MDGTRRRDHFVNDRKRVMFLRIAGPTPSELPKTPAGGEDELIHEAMEN